jgi:hypothetical protein
MFLELRLLYIHDMGARIDRCLVRKEKPDNIYKIVF